METATGLTDMSDGAWLEQWLSEPRFARYLAESGGDRRLALELYEWNLRLGAALMRDVAHLEVALRNCYDQTMCQRWHGDDHWLFDQASPIVAPLWRTRRGQRIDLNARSRRTIREAVLRRGEDSPTSGEIIAELSFGFWRHCTDAAHEKVLWVPYLHAAWPRKTSRTSVERSLTAVNMARNRASHHEPLFGAGPGRDLVTAHRELIRLSGMPLPPLGDYVRESTTVPAILSERPTSASPH